MDDRAQIRSSGILDAAMVHGRGTRGRSATLDTFNRSNTTMRGISLGFRPMMTDDDPVPDDLPSFSTASSNQKGQWWSRDAQHSPKTSKIAERVIAIGHTIWWSTEYNEGRNGMVQYDRLTNRIKKSYPYPLDFEPRRHAVCAKKHGKNTTIYIVNAVGRNQCVYAFNPKKKRYSKFKDIPKNFQIPPNISLSCCIVKDELFVFGGLSKRGLLINLKTKQRILFKEENIDEGLSGSFICEYQGELLRFGGYNVGSSDFSYDDKVYIGSVQTQTSQSQLRWFEMKELKLPHGLHNAGFVRQKYKSHHSSGPLEHDLIFMFGGYGDNGPMKHCYALDLKPNEQHLQTSIARSPSTRSSLKLVSNPSNSMNIIGDINCGGNNMENEFGWKLIEGIRSPLGMNTACLIDESVHIFGRKEKGHHSIPIDDLTEALALDTDDDDEDEEEIIVMEEEKEMNTDSDDEEEATPEPTDAEENERLHQQIQELQGKLQEKDKAIVDMEEKHRKEVESMKKEHSIQIANFQKEAERQRTALQEITEDQQQELTRSKMNIERLQKDKVSLDQDLRETRKSLVDLKELEHAQANEMVKTQKEQLESLQKDYNTLLEEKQKISNKMEKMQIEVDRGRETIKKLENAVRNPVKEYQLQKVQKEKDQMHYQKMQLQSDILPQLKEIANEIDDPQLEALKKKMEKILNEENVEIKPYSKTQLRATMNESKRQNVSLVKKGSERDRNLMIMQTRKQLMELQMEDAADGSTIEKTLKWISTYLAYRFPLPTTAVNSLIAVEHWVDTLHPTEECSEMYQIIKWGCFGGTVAYLGLITFKQMYVDSASKFVKEVWMDFLVLPLLLMSMVAFPPLECYAGSSSIVTLAGVAAVVAIGAVAFIYEKVGGSSKKMEDESDGGEHGDKTGDGNEEEGDGDGDGAPTDTMDTVLEMAPFGGARTSLNGRTSLIGRPNIGGGDLGNGSIAGHIVMESVTIDGDEEAGDHMDSSNTAVSYRLVMYKQ